MRYLERVGVRGFQKRVAGTISVLIKEEEKWVQVFIIGPVDATAIRETELIFFTGIIAHKHGREKTGVAALKSTVLPLRVTKLAAIVVGIFSTQAGLQPPFF